MSQPILSPSRLWKRMTPAQRQQAALAFWRSEQAADDHVQAILLISKQKKFRPKTVMGLDEERKARQLASISSLPESIAARALVTYHLAEQRPMMRTFLDLLGMSHDDGLIQDDHPVPDPAKVAPAADELARQFPPESVSLYLNTLLAQDPDTWKLLMDVPQRQDPVPS